MKRLTSDRESRVVRFERPVKERNDKSGLRAQQKKQRKKKTNSR